MPGTGYTGTGGLLSIDLDAVRANYNLLRQRLGGVACAAVVKADAYGLGAAKVAPVLAAEGCRHFFVAHIDEAVALRPHLPASAELFVLNGVPPGAEDACIEHGAIPVLNSLGHVEAWAGMARERGGALPAVLQVDTGMSRLGLPPEELAIIGNEPQRLDGVALRYVMSHLGCAERQDDPMNAEQLRRFRAARAVLPDVPATLANSSGIFLGPEYHFDLARPGAALYGVAPVAGQPNPMRPVVRLQGRVIQIREIGAGSAVGYGATWRANGPCRIATVSVGYADGFLRGLSNRGCAFVGDRAVPLAGIVSMDTVTFDVSDLPSGALAPGGFVDLIGDRNPIDAVAGEAGTIAYEILTSLGHRYARRYIGG
jgi:alanine racemase